MNNHADLILPHLWLGNFYSAVDQTFLLNNRIGFVLNCTQQESPLEMYKQLGIQSYQFYLDDCDNKKNNHALFEHAVYVQNMIESYLSRGINVLVHCHAGMQRSATLIAVYLMTKYGCFDINDVIQFIKSKRPIAFGQKPTLLSFLKQFCVHQHRPYAIQYSHV